MKLILAALALTTAFAAAAPTTDAAAFEKLKTLKGTWDGPEMPGMGKLRTTYRTIAAGSAVLETNMPGTKNEMVSLYTLNSRGRLVLTHYCMLGNQPRAILDPKRSTDSALVFKADGGENLKRTAMHMHGMKIEFASANKLVCACESYKDGKSQGEHSSTLRRVK
jgi:hypothetical protein